MNGMTHRSSFGGYPEINGYVQQPYYNNGMKPQIYTVRGPLTQSAAVALPAEASTLPGRMLI